MKRFNIYFLMGFLFTGLSAMATTWDEPWQDKIIREADSFVLAKVLSFDAEKGVEIKILKNLAGKELPVQTKITGFYLLHLCSRSGNEGPEFYFKGVDSCYFFLKKNDKGNQAIATPTSGYAALKDGNVYATYRHSYHQAIVLSDTYEQTMTAIFNNYHGLTYDKNFIKSYVEKYLSLKPAGFSKDEIPTFCAQHVALESIYHLQLTEYYTLILPFLYHTENMHNQISAARALTWYHSKEAQEALLKMIEDKKTNIFAQVICIWALEDSKPVAQKEKLTKIAKDASTEENGFGGNIMDPRVCTSFPTVKGAIDAMIQKL
ncbi:HEAT repeat domain-containing protein [Xanthocytophaga flavus]|nr:HEAT repeat domain-containing protein [Xanthocytophaga flavus]